MSQVGAYEAKTQLSALLDQVETGASITITRNGRPVARLTPLIADSPAAAAKRIIALRARVGKGKLSMKSLINEGRR